MTDKQLLFIVSPRSKLALESRENTDHAMLSLVELNSEEIAHIVSALPEGKIQDIYSLTPSKKGILFHHMIQQDKDPYVSSKLYIAQTKLILKCIWRH